MSEPTPLLAPITPPIIAPRLWTGGRLVSDPWSYISDDEPLPIDGSLIVSLLRWRSNKVALISTKQSLGVRVLPTETIEMGSDTIHQCELVALVFPKFTDGRAYSAARRLREAGFKGEIRAIGDVLLDQLPLMLRAGFTSFEITNFATVEFLEARNVPAISRVYQAGSEASAHTWESRRMEIPSKPAVVTGKRAS